MPPDAFDFGIFLYAFVRLVVASVAVVLAIQWKRNDLIAGLVFLLLYTIFDMINIFYSTMFQKSLLDVSHFGFIILALISFIIGMWLSVKKNTVPG